MSVDSQAFPSSQILEAIRVRLRRVLSLDDQYVRLCANDQYAVSNEETLIAIRPLGPTPYTDAGVGRRARPVERTIRVYIHRRSSVDFTGDDRLAVPLLCDLEDAVLSALDEWWPKDVDNVTPITIEPLHPTDSSNGPPTRKSDNDVGEVFSRLDFSIKYVASNETPMAADL